MTNMPARALVIAAHPDDADYGAGGLIATWTAQGCTVTVVCVTDGDSGGFDAKVAREDVPGIRRAEQQAAADALGVFECVFLGRPDGWVVVDRELRLELARTIRRVRPEVVVTHAAERNYRFVYLSHPDHLATGAAALAAVYPDARNEFAFPELELAPWEVAEVWQFGGPEDNRAVDVTDVFALKVKACSAHDSQTPMLDGGVEEQLREDLGRTAAEHGLPAGRLAESFRVIPTA
ncbi:MAG: PIG-L family deacetylase [Frankiales bacterium]|nr:PIG-L family deacetylase [Frankiales bacterium]